ncbi:ARABIDILLO-1 [Striga asiatica]|uniref:ARABIDILLO-1 n=1 Tax=Striga asiatica TaxID=4170 RepID=A0A5A7QCG3_STRAF|nr:ARABIDILLO-1 [Striga asiatica]
MEAWLCVEAHYCQSLWFMTTPGVCVHDDGIWLLWNLRGVAQVDIESKPGQNLQNPIFLDDTNSDVLLEDVMEDGFEVQQQVQSPIQEDPLSMGPNGMDDDHESDVDSCVDSN